MKMNNMKSLLVTESSSHWKKAILLEDIVKRKENRFDKIQWQWSKTSSVFT